MLRGKIKELSDQMHQLTQTVIPTDSKQSEGENKNDSKDVK